MPIPSRRKEEQPSDFMSRCMSNDKLKEEFPSPEQRTAVCISKACETLDYMEAADFTYSYDVYGFEEQINEDNFVIPEDSDYFDLQEDEMEWDVAIEKPILWACICNNSDLKEPETSQSAYLYEHPKTGEVITYNRKGVYTKDGEILIYKGKAGKYQGRKVKLNKPFRTPDGPKKFSVYVKNKKGNVVKVNFGDPKMEIKRDNPVRRKSFRARHKCDTDPGPKWKARYWSCKMW